MSNYGVCGTLKASTAASGWIRTNPDVRQHIWTAKQRQNTNRQLPSHSIPVGCKQNSEPKPTPESGRGTTRDPKSHGSTAN